MSSNFEFIRADWPETYGDCVRAEGYGRTDPRSAVFYARRVVERVVVLIYDVEGLPLPYRTDVAARIGATEFKRVVGPEVVELLGAIRRIGNAGVHDSRAIPGRTALNVLARLHEVLVWAAQRYSRTPAEVPTTAGFDPSQIPAPQDPGSQPPLSPAELTELLHAFEARDQALAEAKETNQSLQAEITDLRTQIAAAQRAKAHPAVDVDLDEAATRDLYIDALLLEAGWELTDSRDRELAVVGLPTPTGDGRIDYVLWGDDGLPLGIVEAKRTSRDPAVGQQQATLYADALERTTGRRPVVFWSNGYEHWIWDDAAGYPPRRIQGFYTKDELELMVQRRHARLPLAQTPVDKDIAGRHYQVRAVRAVGEALEQQERAALLVMATGSGKTRTAVALVHQLMAAGWVKRVLFLADRRALVRQATNAFKTHLPGVTTVNLVEEKVTDGRVYVSTYPTMLGLVNDTDDRRRPFGPGHFDLVIIDEAHRSVYQKYGAVFDWFDAILLGLTATPKDEVDRNTYSLFHLEDGVPTDAYGLDDAVAEGYLVPPVPVSVPLRFLRRGIRYAELSEAEKDEWDSLEWTEDGEVPDAVDPEELNRWLFNADTVDKVIATLMTQGHRVAGGDRIGKTIVFAKNQAHAEFVKQRFDLAYPELGGRAARVVTHQTDYAQTLIADFSDPASMPDIAISVDMLDTGIDVPEVVNLVFFKLVRSASKFWQMIGRGTRLSPDLFGPGQDKKNFYVFDFCQNLEFFSQPGAGSEGSLHKSLSQRLFEARLALVSALDRDGTGDGDTGVDDGADDERDGTTTLAGLRRDTAGHLREIVAGMNLDNVLVRAQRRWVERYCDPAAWHRVDRHEAGEVAERLGGLPTSVRDTDEHAKRFDLLVLRLQLAHLDDDVALAQRLRRQVQEIAAMLLAKRVIPAIAAHEALLAEVAEDEWWRDVTLPMLELARRRLRGLVALIDRRQRMVVYTDFVDELGEGSVVDLPRVGVGTNWERFREKTRAYLRAHEDHVTLQRLRRNRQLTEHDLAQLEELLVAAGATRDELARAREESHGLGLFIRSLVGLDREAATTAFAEFLAGGTQSASEIRFIELIIDHLTSNGVVEARRLYESPFTDVAPHGPDTFFSDEDVDRIVVILDEVRANAAPEPTVA